MEVAQRRVLYGVCTLVNNSQGTFKGIPRRPTTHVCIGVHALLLRHYFTYDVAYLLSSSCEPSYENVFYITDVTRLSC